MNPAVTDVFRALGEPARLSILRHLFTGEHSVRELTDHLHLAQSTVSVHLGVLRDCGLVTLRTVGRSSRYSLADPSHLDTLLRHADRLVQAADLPEDAR